jgi:uncharacterized membrane protein YdbT with pleckstrin-like domain
MIQYEQGEEIVKQVRKHWLVFVIECVFILFLAIVPVLSFVFLPESALAAIADNVAGDFNVLFMFFYLLWLVVLWLILFYIWTDYYLDVWIITNQRIIDVEQKGFFNREVASLHLDRIQDITIMTSGFVATMFGYGNIHVQTAGADRNFLIPNASDPEGVKRIILEQYAKITRRSEGGVI